MLIIHRNEICKKRKKASKMYDFHTFCKQGYPFNSSGPFRDNIRMFLDQCCDKQNYTVDGMHVWRSFLMIHSSSSLIPLYAIEEDVRKSPQPFCNQCRCTGWSNNFVSKRRYHVIMPVYEEWNRQLDDGVCDLQTHLLHGLIHSNGYGHLLCINGIEGGSKNICGRDIMDLWDRFCTSAGARKISVEDISKSRSMDLRLLYGVAYGHPWFGKWGYKFCRGSFGVSEINYKSALEILSSLQLDHIILDYKDKEIKLIIEYYRDLSKTRLITLRDIFKLMITLKSCPCFRKNSSSTSWSLSAPSKLKRPPLKDKGRRLREFKSLASTLGSRWPIKRLEYTAEVVAEALRERKATNYGDRWMTRQELRDAARTHIGDTGLLDYVLKSMNNVIIGRHVIRRSVNPETRILEYSIDEHDFQAVELNSPSWASETDDTISEEHLVPGTDIVADLSYFYNVVLLNYPKSELVQLASQVILDSKQFSKEWPFIDEEYHVLKFTCEAIVEETAMDLEQTRSPNTEKHPGEIIILPIHATIRELKLAAEIAFRDTYCMMKNFMVTDINGLEGLENEELVYKVLESGRTIYVNGSGMDWQSKLTIEAGPEIWKVQCECGTVDDDGERMVACDVCQVWQHTRCNGIEDSEVAPMMFVCTGCCSSLHPVENDDSFIQFEDCRSTNKISMGGYTSEFPYDDGIGLLL